MEPPRPIPISPVSLIPPSPPSEFTSLTETLYYSQLSEGIVIHKGESRLDYNHKTYIPTRIQGRDVELTDYPFGWTADIEAFCQKSGHHPDCRDPIRRSFIEREFIASIINNPDSVSTLDDYLQTIHANTIGYNLQWLMSSPTPVDDDSYDRLELTHLYTQVNSEGGRIFHTKKGLRITIPEERWVHWRTRSPSSQKEFSRVAWAQLTQFDKMALITRLREGKIGPKTIHLDFDNAAEPRRSPNTELDTVCQYYVELVSQTGAYRFYNHYVLQELAHNNEPLQLPVTYDWNTNGRPRFVFLPYSRLLLIWNTPFAKWEYKCHSRFVPHPSPTRLGASSKDGLPSLLDPTDDFEVVDHSTA